MTTNLLQLAETVTKDTEDTLIQEVILKNLGEIRRALADGRDYTLKAPNGAQIVIRAKRAAAQRA